MARERHQRKQVEQALRYAESEGCEVEVRHAAYLGCGVSPERAAAPGLKHTQGRRRRRPADPPLRPEEPGAVTEMESDAFRLHEALDDEVGVEDGPRGHFIGFDRQAESFLDAVLDALADVIELGFE